MNTAPETITMPNTTAAPFTAGPDYIGYIDFALTVDEIAKNVIDQVKLAKAACSRSVWAAINAGALIATAKKKLNHGEFEQWVVDHCEISLRTAQAYMRLAKRTQELPKEEAQRVALLPIREAIKAVTSPVITAVDENTADDHGDVGDDHGIQLKGDFRRNLEQIAKVSAAAARADYINPNALTRLRNKLRDALSTLDYIAEYNASLEVVKDGT